MVRAILQTLKIVAVAATAILVVAGGLRGFAYAVERTTPEDTGEKATITVAKDASADQVADQLVKAGLIRSKFLFTSTLRMTSSAPKEGKYALTKGMTVAQIADRVSGAEVAAADAGSDEGDDGDGEDEPFQVTVPEGWRTEQVAEEAEKQGLAGGYDAFMEATKTVNIRSYDFLAQRPAGASLEGYLFPDTYDFDPVDAEYNVQLMLDRFDAQFTQDMRDKAAKMGITIHDVLIVASLIEREAKVDEERPIIADIYLKRWVEGWELEADPTVQYVVGKRGDWWPTKLTEEQLLKENPYNTYSKTGLPPNPICNPGIKSIQAVLSPAETEYYYFYAIPDESGKHLFATTIEEQTQNIDRYRDEDD